MTTIGNRPADPRALDLPALCRHGQTVEGRWPLAAMTRLSAGLFDAPAADDAVGWSAAGSLMTVAGGEPQLWLALRALAVVRLQCQRCLQPLAQPIEIDRRLRFVRDDDEAARLDEESEDDVLALPPRLDLPALLEDELILALPLVPRHEQCDEPLPLSGDDEAAGADDTPNPFAALAALRKRGPD